MAEATPKVTLTRTGAKELGNRCRKMMRVGPAPIVRALPAARPVYREFPSWDKPTRGCRRLTDLPAGARKYLEFLEKELGTLIVGVSVGADREEMIWTPTGVTT